MDFSLLLLGLFFLSFLLLGGAFGAANDSFDQNYYITWGYDHVRSLNQGRQIQLSLDTSSGAGFGSKLHHFSGFFYSRLKLPNKDSSGVVTAFYLTSQGDNHDEIDFEFLGNKEGKPIILSTNVFANGVGNREQRFSLWFDPKADFHSYQILWNQHHIVFYVDDVPIRVFKNLKRIGVDDHYPSKPMQIEASLWNGDSWATDGGRTRVKWSNAPFQAVFQGFDIAGCPADDQNSNINQVQHCYSSQYWWNWEQFRKLDSTQRRRYHTARKYYMKYDYCSDRPRYPTPPKECFYNH